MHGLLRPIALLAALLSLLAGGLVPIAAQEATPEAVPMGPPAGDLEVVASGLINPRAFIWGADGSLYVAQAGSGGTNPATEDAPTTAILGPFGGGPSASVVRIDGGCPVLVAGGLASTITGTGEVLGAEDVAILGDHLYVSVDGGGPVHGNPDAPSGVYRILADGTTELVADLSTWTRENRTALVPPDDDPDAAGFSMVADEAAGVLWVLNPNAGEIVSVTPDGTISRVVDLSEGHPVPTGMAVDPQGGVFVGTLTSVPYPEGAAHVDHIAADGTVTEEVWIGLTAVTSVAVGPDGTLYAVEMSTGNTEAPPFVVPGSGRVVRQTGPDSAEEVATGLTFPLAIDFGPDGALYVSGPAIGANEGGGVIARIDLAAEPGATPEAAEAPVCEPVTGAAPAAAGTPEA